MRVKEYSVKLIDNKTSVESLTLDDGTVFTKVWERNGIGGNCTSRDNGFVDQAEEHGIDDEEFLDYIYDEYDDLWLGSSILTNDYVD